MGRKRLTEEPQIVAAIISVIGTLVGTLLISILLGFMEGRIALGALVAVISFLLLIAIWVLLVIRWGVRLAASAAAVMVIVGSVLFLIVTVARLIPFGVPISTPVALASSPTPQAKPALTPTPLPPAFTPSPFTAGPCRIAYEKDGDIYVRNCDGSGDHRLTDHPALDGGPAWSPDGQRIVFTSQRDRQPTTDGRVLESLYIVNADGSNLTRLTFEEAEETNDTYPDWSPDGNQIAFHHNCNLATINPDGSDLRVILPKEAYGLCVDEPTWSPDGQRLAFAGHPPGSQSRDYTICVVNADGTGLLKLGRFQTEVPRLAWSPDGSQVGLEVIYDGGSKYYLMNADGSGEPVETSSIPESWYPWHWPKWGGEEKKPAASTAEEVRAFAEPILAAIADRPPDFSDDFSDPGSGWPEGEIPEAQGKQGYSGGEYFIQVSPDTCGTVITNRLPEISDFVLKMDGRFVSSSEGGCWQVRFRISPDDDAYALMLHLGGELNIDLQVKKGTQIVGTFQGPPIQPGLNQTNSLQIVAKGPQIAVVVNGEPLFLVRDERLSRGSITLPVCNSGDTPLEVHFDNFEIWDISDLSL